MKNTLRFPVAGAREWLAWLALTLSLVLFAATVSLAQQPAPERASGTVHLKLEKEEDGKTTRIDTTFDLQDMDHLHDMLRSFDSSLDPDEGMNFPDGGRMEKMFRLHHPELSPEDREKFDAEMGQLRERMKDLRKEMRELRIELLADSGLEAPTRGDFHWRSDDGASFADPGTGALRKHRQCIRINTDSLDGGTGSIILESPDGEQHVIRLDENGDEEKIIIIRKSHDGGKESGSAAPAARQPSAANAAKLPVRAMKVFPNPGDGRLTVSFRLEREGETTVDVTDAAGTSVYREKLSHFSGIYEKQLDLSGKAKGTYYLTVTQDGRSATRKFVIE
jgi:hypothetical protein